MKSSRQWLGVVALAVLYVVTAKLGIELSVAQGVVTPIWIPTGLSLATLLLFGYRLWPGIALGAFVANATSDVSAGIAAGIAVGNTAEALLGAYLLRRSGFDNGLHRVRAVLLLVFLGAGVATMVAATNGATVLLVGGAIEAGDYLSRWSLWWFGDAMGLLLVTPLLLVCFGPRSAALRDRSAAEAVALLLALIGASAAVFLGGSWRYPYILFPLLIWATLRFRQVGATGSIFLISAIAIWGTVGGSVPIGGATETQSVQILQGLVAMVAISIYILGASLDERDAAGHELDLASERNKQALLVNDEIVQGLAAAKGALDLGLTDEHERIVTETLHKARAIVADLLQEADGTTPLGPGDFTREEAVRLEP